MEREKQKKKRTDPKGSQDKKPGLTALLSRIWWNGRGNRTTNCAEKGREKEGPPDLKTINREKGGEKKKGAGDTKRGKKTTKKEEKGGNRKKRVGGSITPSIRKNEGEGKSPSFPWGRLKGSGKGAGKRSRLGTSVR